MRKLSNTPESPIARAVATRFAAAVPERIPADIERDIETVAGALSGAAKNKFLAGVQVIRDSLAQGGWIPRGKAKGGAAIDFAIGTPKNRKNIVFPSGKTRAEIDAMQGTPEYSEQRSHPGYEIAWKVDHAVGGAAFHVPVPPDHALPTVPGVPVSVLRAALEVKRWILLEAMKPLDAARPVPVKTEINLSPKVTSVLQGLHLDIDLSSIKYPKLKEVEFELPDGTEEKQLIVDWPTGTKLNMTPYNGGQTCQACGKWIPSGKFVPLLMRCNREGLVGMYVGEDCARSIFGLRAKGIQTPKTATYDRRSAGEVAPDARETSYRVPKSQGTDAQDSKHRRTYR